MSLEKLWKTVWGKLGKILHTLQHWTTPGKLQKLAATVAALGVVSGALWGFWLWWHPIIPILRGEVESVQQGETLTLKQYCQRYNLETKDYSPEKLRHLGLVFRCSVKLKGFKGKMCSVRWCLYELQGKGNKQPIEDDLFKNQRACRLRPEADEDTAMVEVWVPVLEKAGNFCVQITLCDHKETQLHWKESTPFEFRKASNATSNGVPSIVIGQCFAGKE